MRDEMKRVVRRLTAWGVGVAAMVGVAAAGSAEAALVDLGNGLIYDNATGLDWLKNANLAATDTFGVSGIGADGSMSWSTAEKWIAAMNAADYLGYSDWRLPELTPINGTALNIQFSYVGATDNGYNIGAPGTKYAGSKASEFSYLYYNSLNNSQICTDTGCKTFNLPPLETGPFENVQSTYWFGTTDPADLNWPFEFVFGSASVPYGEQALANPLLYSFAAWAVRPASVATAVPESGTWAMMLAGLGCLGIATRRKRLRPIAR